VKAMIYQRYGPPDVLEMADLPTPIPAPDELLVAVHAATVTTADMRLRGADFPGGLGLVGRLMTGLTRPRKPVLGGEFSGVVQALGTQATGFSPGQAVFGFAGFGAHAGFLTIKAAGPVLPRPGGLSHAQAAALPFGSLCALVFLRDYARLKAGDNVAVLGASGGVGCYGVQIAVAMGARVTGVASAGNAELVRSLGAAEAVDYRAEDITDRLGQFDVIFDCVGATRFAQARRALKPGGVYLPLEFGLADLWPALVSRLRGGPRMLLGVNGDKKQDLAEISAMVDSGQLRPVIDRSYPLDCAADAHAYVMGRHRKGSVVLSVRDTGDAAAGE